MTTTLPSPKLIYHSHLFSHLITKDRVIKKDHYHRHSQRTLTSYWQQTTSQPNKRLRSLVTRLPFFSTGRQPFKPYLRKKICSLVIPTRLSIHVRTTHQLKGNLIIRKLIGFAWMSTLPYVMTAWTSMSRNTRNTLCLTWEHVLMKPGQSSATWNRRLLNWLRTLRHR